MKKVLFSAAIILGATGICISNLTTTNAQAPVRSNHFVIKDTVPTDTTMKKDSTFKF